MTWRDVLEDDAEVEADRHLYALDALFRMAALRGAPTVAARHHLFRHLLDALSVRSGLLAVVVLQREVAARRTRR
jgi:hypothetical protein